MPARPRSSARRRRAAAVTALACLAVLSGCAGEGDGDTLAGGAEAATAGEAPPVPDDVAATFDAAIGATQAVDSADLQFDVAIVNSMLTFGARLTGEFDRDDVGVATALIADDGDEVRLEMRSDGETAWMTSDAPEVVDALPAGVSWVETTIDEARASDYFTGLDSTFAILPVVRGIRSVEDAGTAEIGGDEVRLFAGEVDWEAALAAAGPGERAGLDESLTFGEDTIAEFTATVGLDGRNRVRRLVLDITTSPSDEGEFGFDTSMTFELEVARLGHDVEVPAAPRSDETVALSEVPTVEAALFDGS